MEDIAPKLLEQLQEDFNARIKKNERLQSLLELVNTGKATYIQAEEAAYEMGVALSQSFGNCLSSAVLLIYDIMAVNEGGLWVHTKVGEEVPRRNGKNEVVVIREMWGLENGERILHTAHRTTTSTSASRRLAQRLVGAGYEEVTRAKKGVKYDKHFTYTKQLGLERIVILREGGGTIDFRTRSSQGGLGEGFDLLVIDEAQEYTDNQETALKYVVTDSKNPQTIFCGTPPTVVSAGTVFMKMRNTALQGESINTYWAEWSVDAMTDPRDKDSLS